MERRLTRSSNGVIGGVCAGLAAYVGWEPKQVRWLFVLSCLIPGPQIVGYLVLWVVMPLPDDGS